MLRRFVVPALFLLQFCGFLAAQHAVDPMNRYFRLICLVHLKGSGKGGDPVVPEYVVEGTAVAQAAAQAAAASNADHGQSKDKNVPQTTPAAAPMSSRPGILAWSMQVSDDGAMVIVQIVAADHHAFDDILADKRGEIRVFEIGKDAPDEIQKEMKKYKKDFDLATFRVAAR